MKYLGMLFLAAVLVGCDTPTNYKVRPTLTRLQPLPRQSPVFIGVLPDTKFAPGLKTAFTFGHHARGYFNTVQAGDRELDVAGNLAAAQQAQSQYLILPTVIWGEDNAPAWSANPDRLELQVTTLNVADGKPLDSGTVLIIGPWGTLDSYSPLEFLDAACQTYLKQLTSDIKPTGTVKRRWQ
jgi:hypothetical protein